MKRDKYISQQIKLISFFIKIKWILSLKKERKVSDLLIKSIQIDCYYKQDQFMD